MESNYVSMKFFDISESFRNMKLHIYEISDYFDETFASSNNLR